MLYTTTAASPGASALSHDHQPLWSSVSKQDSDSVIGKLCTWNNQSQYLLLIYVSTIYNTLFDLLLVSMFLALLSKNIANMRLTHFKTILALTYMTRRQENTDLDICDQTSRQYWPWHMWPDVTTKLTLTYVTRRHDNTDLDICDQMSRQYWPWHMWLDVKKILTLTYVTRRQDNTDLDICDETSRQYWPWHMWRGPPCGRPPQWWPDTRARSYTHGWSSEPPTHQTPAAGRMFPAGFLHHSCTQVIQF